jgi:hypothetical protein
MTAALALIGSGGAAPAGAATLQPAVVPLSTGGPVLYNSSITPLPGNVPSEAFQATQQNSDFGNEITLAGTAPFTLNNVQVTLDSWGCESGSGATCLTTPGATFNWPVTLNIYNVGTSPNTVGSLITSDTQTFAIPYRPSADPTHCASTPTEWFDSAASACYNGMAANVDFALPTNVTLTSANLIYGIAYNTSNYGLNPVGATCAPKTNCAYDSLNVGLTTANAPTVGTDPVPGTVFQSSLTAGQWCDGVGPSPLGTFAIDSPGSAATDACWTPNASDSGSPYYIPAVVFNGVTAPAAPTIGAATAGNASATVAFTAPTTTGGQPITSYTVTAIDSTTPSHGGETATGTTSPITVTGLTNGDSYTFTVTATNDVGTGPASAPSNAITPSTTAPGGTGGTGTGGTGTGTGTSPTATGAYDLVGSDGGVFVFGQPGTGFYGSLPGMNIHVKNIVGIVPTADGKGYFLVGSDGGVFAFGDAPFENSLPGEHVSVNDIVGIVPTKDDKGYFLVGADGGVFAFGDAPFENSLPGQGTHVNNIVGIAATPDNGGYWVVASSGQVYALGDAKPYGSAPSGPVVSITSTPDGGGYWLTTANGGVDTFGDAGFYKSLPGINVNVSNIVSLVPSTDGKGYLLVGADGGLFAFGDATFPGSLPGLGVHVNNIVGAVPVA